MRICRNEAEMKVLGKKHFFVCVGAKEKKVLFVLSASDHSKLVILPSVIKEKYFSIRANI